MIKITKEIEGLLWEVNNAGSDLGIFLDQGAVIGDAKFIIYYADGSNVPYLAHISEFDQDGFFIKLKERKNEK